MVVVAVVFAPYKIEVNYIQGHFVKRQLVLGGHYSQMLEVKFKTKKHSHGICN